MDSTSASGVTVVKLTGGENWLLWKFQTKILLNGLGLLGVVDGSVKKNDAGLKPNEWEQQDAKAQTHIVSRVTENVMQHLVTCCSAAEMWNKLSSIYELKSSTSVHLVHERFMKYKYEDGSIAKLFSTVEQMANQLKQLGESMSDKMIITKILMALPPQYKYFISAWESVPQESQTLNDLQARLLIEEERMKEMEEPVALSVKNMKCYKCGKTGHKKSNCRYNNTCSYCKKAGHTIEQCYFKKNKEKGNSSKENKGNNCKENKCNNSRENKGNSSKDTKGNAYISSAFIGHNSNKHEWIVDSGASDHMTHNQSLFSSFSGINTDRYVIVGDGRKLKVEGIGLILLKAYDGNEYVVSSLNSVLYVPELKVNLFSVTKAVKNGYMFNITGKNCEFIKNNVVCSIGKCVDKLYVMQFIFDSPGNVNVTQVKTYNTLNDWHEKLAHQNYDYCRSVLKNNNIEFIDSDDSCIACIEGKCHRLPFPQSITKTSMCCEILHADVCGPLEVPSVGGSRYILVIKDDFSKYRKVYFVQHKSEVPSKIKDFINHAEVTTNNKVKVLRTDNGTEFLNKTLESFLNNKGIQHQTTVVYTPEQNGKVEREMRTIIEAARTMLIQSNLDKSLWAEAVSTAVYTLNRTYVKNKNTGKTPYECWWDKKFDINNLHKFGSMVVCHVPKEIRRKLDPKGKKGYFVGYSEETKGYRIYYKEENKIKIRRDVVFIKYSDSNSKHKIPDSEIEILVENNNEKPLVEINDVDRVAQDENSMDRSIQSEVSVIDEESSQNLSNTPSVESNNESEEEFHDTNTVQINEVQTQVEQIRNLRPRNQIKQPEWHKYYSTDYTCLLGYIEDNPKTYEEAMNSADRMNWKRAMDEEIDSLNQNNTWELVPKPVDCKVIDSKWVFKRKLDDQGNITSYKARLVARGFQQTDFIDDDLFAPVAKLPTVRTLLAICNQKAMSVHQMDVKSAFLHGDIKDEIYLSLPEGCSNGDMICKLKKSLYGLKSSPKNWNDKFNSVILSEGFKQCKTDYGLYVKQYNGQMVYLLLYVDDLLLAGTDIECVNNTKNLLKKHFCMKDLGLATYFLGIAIKQDVINGVLKINQEAFLKQILQKYNMSDCNSIATPMDSKFKTDSLKREKSETQELETRCRQLIGCLLYAVLGSRPDLCASVSILSRFQKCASEELWNMLKRILMYIKGTLDLSLVFERNNTNDAIIVGYVDSDWGGDLVDRRSTAGFIFKVFGCPVSWCTRKQPSVAMSSTEAEYMALSMATAEACWLKQLLRDFSFDIDYVLMYEDNQSSIRVAKNPVLHKRMKHIDIKHHFIREKIVDGTIMLNYIGTSEQIADLLTKPLSGPTFIKLRGYLKLT